jgi:hypothetical protein
MYVLAVVVSFLVVFLLCLFVCNVCHFSVVLLYYCHRVKAQLQFNKYMYVCKSKVSEAISVTGRGSL